MSCPAGYTFDTTPRVAPFATVTETLVPGERFQYWDYDIMWTKNHIPASKLEPLRRLGDPLADDALAALEIKPGEDAVEALLAYTAQASNEQRSSAPQQLLTQVMAVPDWVDWDRVQRGQQVYWRYCLFISHALLHFSLAGGFSIPKITKVLNSTGYLSGKRTKERVLETSQFVLDVVHSLDNLQPGSGTAWKSIIQVRFLHAGVRSRLSKISRAHSKYYNLEEHGVPINQEDLLGTLFSFSNTMWRVMETRMDVHMTTQEREDYLHLWRYVGYMMGVDDILGVTQTPERADACLESIVLHLADPDRESGRLCSTLLRNIAPQSTLTLKIIKAIGLPDPYKVHMALAEHLLGSEFWKVNGLPSMTLPYRFFKELILYFMFFDLWLVTKSPWWFRFRSPLLREGQNIIISNELGDRRAQFELKKVPRERGNEPVHRMMGEDGTSDDQLWPRVLMTACVAIGVALVLAQQG
ncbi:hypothetical protein KVV02_004429 [Mortierella alpina]|uniref:ER-bound oxygenase mpaB/mpaB'/Rubber oxygenase catalytic domain-containing protein n=1 Tax=Mortierella alpina TaxID=64518 RepID=A0A9P8A5P0_MORAP|nr:hypothetical protein KVV02_004429 [Mortierella alpina]